jgi:hypothetical protein
MITVPTAISIRFLTFFESAGVVAVLLIVLSFS